MKKFIRNLNVNDIEVKPFCNAGGCNLVLYLKDDAPEQLLNESGVRWETSEFRFYEQSKTASIKLTLWEDGSTPVSRIGVGGDATITTFKKAYADALKRALMSFGVGDCLRTSETFDLFVPKSEMTDWHQTTNGEYKTKDRYKLEKLVTDADGNILQMSFIQEARGDMLEKGFAFIRKGLLEQPNAPDATKSNADAPAGPEVPPSAESLLADNEELLVGNSSVKGKLYGALKGTKTWENFLKWVSTQPAERTGSASDQWSRIHKMALAAYPAA